MIKTKFELKTCLQIERKNYGITGYVKFFVLRLIQYENAILWSFQRRLRITEYHKNRNNKIRFAVNWFLLNRMKMKYNLHIGMNVFDVGLKIMHLGPILVNANVKVGKNCSIHSNTALVARGTDDSVPHIGDDVVIGYGACLLGGIRIANGIAIGAKALVNKSFMEEGVAIAGNPAHKISNNGKANWGKK